MKVQTDNGYEIEFTKGLEDRPEAQHSSPYRGDTVRIPFIIRGEPGLLDVRFEFKNTEDKDLDVYIEPFSSVLRPGGFWTNFFGRKAKHQLVGEVAVPKRLFPIQIHDIKVENLSRKQLEKRA